MKKLLCQIVICVLICTAAGNPMVSAQQQRPAEASTGMRIVVLEGEDAVNLVQQKTAVRPLVEVRDSNNLPVAGATVLFTIVRTGGRSAVSFANGQSAVTVTTDAAGRAASSPLQATGNGAVRIDVRATYRGQVATATVSQTNFATAADASRAGRTVTGSIAALAGVVATGAAASSSGRPPSNGRAAGAGTGAGGAGDAGGTAARTGGTAGVTGAAASSTGSQTSNGGTVGVITGAVASSSGRKLSNITMQLVDQRGMVVSTTVTTRNGEFTIPPASYDTYTLQCVDRNKVIGTASVTLKSATESIKITCASDTAAPFWKKPGMLAGLAAAAAAVGATAVVAATGDASGSR
ncbi:MAG TPA: hypothetical protein VH436_34665 [Vicinamibacterales bacterium]|jgi:hypothetical protein